MQAVAWVSLSLTLAMAATVWLRREGAPRLDARPFALVVVALAAIVGGTTTVREAALAFAAFFVPAFLIDRFIDEAHLAESAVALGLAGTAMLFGFGPGWVEPGILFGAVAGTCAGGCLGRFEGRPGAVMEAGVVGMAAVCASGLGAAGLGERFTQTGSLLAFGGLVAGVAAWSLGRFLKDAPEWLPRVAAAAIFAVLAAGLGLRYFFVADFAWIAVGAVALTAVVAYMAGPPDQPNGTAVLLGSVAWLAAATLAFGMRQGLGVAVLALCGVVAAVLLGSRAALVATSPVVGLGAYRLFRELNPDVTRAFDIGQHYALVGLLLGVLAVVLAADWAARARSELAVLALAVGAAAATTVVGAMAFLGAKGSVGLVFGLALAPVLVAVGGRLRSASMGLAFGLAALLFVAQPLVGEFGELGRDAKVGLVLGVGGLVAAVVVMVAWLGRQRSEVAK